MANTNPFTAKAESWESNRQILEAVDDDGKIMDQTAEYFDHWIENDFDGDLDEWLAHVLIEEQTVDGISCPVPTIQTQFGNYFFHPAYHRWMDDDEFEEYTAE